MIGSSQSQQEIKIAFDPPGDGNCQFEALTHQLSVQSICKGASKLRQDAVQHLQYNRNAYESFMDCPSKTYLTNMSNEGSYSDHLTLISVAREYNCQILVMSTDGIQLSRIISNDGNYDPTLRLLSLG